MIVTANYENLTRQREADACQWAMGIWLVSKDAQHHPYLARMGIGPSGSRIFDGWLSIEGMALAGALVIRMIDAEGRLHNLQFIAPNGQMRFVPGGRRTGTYWGIRSQSETIVVTKDFAEAARHRAHTRHSVAAAFEESNIPLVAERLRTKYPSMRVMTLTEYHAEAEAQPASHHDAAGPQPLPERQSRSQSRPLQPLQNPEPAQARRLNAVQIPDPPEAKKLLDWLQRTGLTKVSRRGVQQRGPNCIRRGPKAKAALGTLVETGWLATEDNVRYELTLAALSTFGKEGRAVLSAAVSQYGGDIAEPRQTG